MSSLVVQKKRGEGLRKEASHLFIWFSTGEDPHIRQKMRTFHRCSESFGKDFLTTTGCSAGCVLAPWAGPEHKSMLEKLSNGMTKSSQGDKGTKARQKDILEERTVELVLEGWDYQELKLGTRLLRRKVIWGERGVWGQQIPQNSSQVACVLCGLSWASYVPGHLSAPVNRVLREGGSGVTLIWSLMSLPAYF